MSESVPLARPPVDLSRSAAPSWTRCTWTTECLCQSSAPSVFDGILELEKQSPGSAGAFMLLLSSGGRAARIYCEYNAPLYNQRENSKSLVIIAPVGSRNETKRREGRSCTLWPAGAGATELTKGYTKTKTKNPNQAKPTICKKQSYWLWWHLLSPGNNTIFATWLLVPAAAPGLEELVY